MIIINAIEKRRNGIEDQEINKKDVEEHTQRRKMEIYNKR